jgi:hypothetical protein
MPKDVNYGSISVYMPINGVQTLVAWKDGNGNVHREPGIDVALADKGAAMLGGTVVELPSSFERIRVTEDRIYFYSGNRRVVYSRCDGWWLWLVVDTDDDPRCDRCGDKLKREGWPAECCSCGTLNEER